MNQALKTWTFFFSSLHSTCSSTRRSIIVPSTFVHGRDHESTDYRVVQSGIFLFTTPFERLLVYVKLVTTYIQLPSSTADDARWLKTRKLTSSKSFARILLQSYTLCYYRLIISLILPFHFVFWAAIAAFTRFTYLPPHFTQKTKMDFTPRPGSSINWSEGNGDSRGGLPLRWGALFASTLLHST